MNNPGIDMPVDLSWSRTLLLRLILLSLLVLCYIPTKGFCLFVDPPSVVIKYPELKLRSADRIHGLSYEGVANDAGKAASLPSFALSLNAKFIGRLTRDQFDALLKSYCGWSETKSRITYDKDREDYTLLDFLPPLMQATSGLHFKSSRRKQKGLPSLIGGPTDRAVRNSEQEVLLTSNCWGTYMRINQLKHGRTSPGEEKNLSPFPYLITLWSFFQLIPCLFRMGKVLPGKFYIKPIMLIPLQ
jgi:hypothetical protein